MKPESSIFLHYGRNNEVQKCWLWKCLIVHLAKYEPAISSVLQWSM